MIFNNLADAAGKYQLIYVDPPWQYRDKCNDGRRGAAFKFATIGMHDLRMLQIRSLAHADGAMLAMWWTGPFMREALALVDAWGFQLRTATGFTWVKTCKSDPSKYRIGMGHYTRQNAENCLFATVGRYPRSDNNGVRQIIQAPRKAHSEKPSEAALRLVEMCGDVPRIELFARSVPPGWDGWGLEASHDDHSIDAANETSCEEEGVSA